MHDTQSWKVKHRANLNWVTKTFFFCGSNSSLYAPSVAIIRRKKYFFAFAASKGFGALLPNNEEQRLHVSPAVLTFHDVSF